MKIVLMLSLILLNVSFVSAESTLTLTENQIEEIEIVEKDAPVTKISIAEIKNYLSTINPETTCMDEYIQRRKQLFIQLGLTPATAVVAGVAGVYVGGMTGVTIGNYQGGMDGWAGLAYAIGGAMIGGGSAIIIVGAQTTLAAISVYDIDLVVKSLGELHIRGQGAKSDKLYSKYKAKSGADALSKEEFFSKLLEADAAGTLCDGSIVKQPKIKLSFSKLKYKVAKSKEIRKFFNKI